MNEVDNIKKRSDNIKKRSEKKNEVKKFERFRNNPRRPLTNEEKKKLDVHILKLVKEQKILDEERELFKGGRTRRMKKNVKKITNKKKTSIKAKTRRIRRRITTCRGRKTFRRRN